MVAEKFCESEEKKMVFMELKVIALMELTETGRVVVGKAMVVVGGKAKTVRCDCFLQSVKETGI